MQCHLSHPMPTFIGLVRLSPCIADPPGLLNYMHWLGPHYHPDMDCTCAASPGHCQPRQPVHVVPHRVVPAAAGGVCCGSGYARVSRVGGGELGTREGRHHLHSPVQISVPARPGMALQWASTKCPVQLLCFLTRSFPRPSNAVSNEARPGPGRPLGTGLLFCTH